MSSQNGNKDQRIVPLSKEIADKIKVLRLRDIGVEAGGFQRRLNTRRATEIVNAVKGQASTVIPPIILAEVNGDYICVDGQHRLEAWKRHAFPLQAYISPMSLAEANANFVLMNSTARRVSLSHRLQVDQSDFAKRIRAMADKFLCSPNIVWGLLGIAKSDSSQRGDPAKGRIGHNEWQLVDAFLMEWTKDKRWKSEVQVYNKIGVLRTVFSLASKTKAPIQFVKSVQKMNFNPGTALYTSYGSTSWNLKAMKAIIAQWILEHD